MRSGSRDHLGVHNTGNVVMKFSSQDRGYILIDGQQRVTTCLLLLAAVRDAALQLAPDGAEDELGARASGLLVDIQSLLFVKNSTTKEPESRLVPCLMDRAAYTRILSPCKATGYLPRPGLQQPADGETSGFEPSSQRASGSGPVTSANEEAGPLQPANEEIQSFQMGTYEIFMDCLNRELKSSKDPKEKLATLTVILNQSLDKMGVTLVDILTPVDLAQVFLWLQEKSLMGMSAFLKNDRPGARFAATDLVRNLLMAPFMDRSLEAQEAVYRTHWQEPLEMKFGSAAAFGSAMESYIKVQHPAASRPSQFEETVASFAKTFPNLRDVELYAKFVTIYEDKRRESERDSLADISLQLMGHIRRFFFSHSLILKQL